MRRFRWAAVAGMIVPALIALAARGVDISVLVGWAFALAASTFCPLFLLGIWWRGLTARGAIAGMAAGGLVASTRDRGDAGRRPGPDDARRAAGATGGASVPVAFLTMIGVSLRDPERPVGTEETMLALHGPEGLGLEALRARLGSSAELPRNGLVGSIVRPGSTAGTSSLVAPHSAIAMATAGLPSVEFLRARIQESADLPPRFGVCRELRVARERRPRRAPARHRGAGRPRRAWKSGSRRWSDPSRTARPSFPQVDPSLPGKTDSAARIGSNLTICPLATRLTWAMSEGKRGASSPG